MKRLLWLDDIRNPFEYNWLRDYSPIDKPYNVIWVKKYYEFVEWIEKNGLPDAICFDHDLSDIYIEEGVYKEKTGYNCAKMLVEYCLAKNLELPKWNVQSANPVGKANINGLLNSFKNRKK
jgi:hypothetical protein